MEQGVWTASPGQNAGAVHLSVHPVESHWHKERNQELIYMSRNGKVGNKKPQAICLALGKMTMLSDFVKHSSLSFQFEVNSF